MQILDGRSHFYQWDLNQVVTSEGLVAGDEVHFANAATAKALVVKAYAQEDGRVVADVPNILLQAPYPIAVYRYIKQGASEHTRKERTFSVKKRPRPSDYIYTETEIASFEELSARMREMLDALARFSGVYTLAEGETPSDAPEDADVVIDPNGGHVGAVSRDEFEKYKTAHANDYTNAQIDAKIESAGGGSGGGSINPDDLEGVLRYTEQTLTEEEKAQARANIDAADPALVGDAAVGVGMYMMGTLKWDGSIGDRHSVTISEGDGMSLKFVRVSEEVPQSDMAYSYSLATFGGMLGISGGLLEFRENGGVLWGNLEGAPAVLVVLDDNIELADGVYLKKGIYFEAMCFDIDEGLPSITVAFVSSLYMCGHEFKTATTHSIFDEIVGSDTVTHDGVVRGEYVEVWENEGDVHPVYWVKVADAVPTLADLTDKTLSMSIVMVGETHTEDIHSTDIEVYDSGVIGISSLAIIIPTDNFNVGEITFQSRGVYFFGDSRLGTYVSRLTIPGYTGFDPKIKEEYIPNIIQRVGEAVIINSSTEGSTKRFKITVDDSGTISATEVY